MYLCHSPTQIVRSKIINNSNLASIAHHYSFGARMHINVTQEAVLREAESILGAAPHTTRSLDLFTDASDLPFLPFLFVADVFEAYVGAVYTEQGFDRTTIWLNELFTPYAELAYSEALAENNTPIPNGSLMRLNELLQRAGMPPVRWMDRKVKSATGVSMWKLDAIVDQRHVGTGIAPSKARAKNIAAEEALKVFESPPASEALLVHD
jgi:dsRNA-specific ribonuclease